MCVCLCVCVCVCVRERERDYAAIASISKRDLNKGKGSLIPPSLIVGLKLDMYPGNSDGKIGLF